MVGTLAFLHNASSLLLIVELNTRPFTMLLFAGVSIASVARRLGHSSMTTTQETYLHIIQELENQDNDKIIRILSSGIFLILMHSNVE
jgi:hypothetical protein